MKNSSTSLRRISSMCTVVSLVAGLSFAVVVAQASSASAAVLPTPAPISQRTANNVTADALPTVQIDGVVWSQTVVGNTVYAGGQFKNARPAGAAAGTNLTPRNNLVSYDITTGVMNSFNPNLNAQVKVVTASPDGKTLYVGGQFTAAGGVTRYRIAAFNTANGALISSFHPAFDATVSAIAATNTTVYIGGAFSRVGSVGRSHLAAVNASNGALLGWQPTADSTVTAMVLTPDGSKLIVGGNFKNINSAPAYGLGALDPSSAALLPWTAGTVVKDAGSNSAITSLTTDGTAIYGAGYVFGPGGNLEGSFSANPNSGAINWIEDCHGDTYGVFGSGSAVYTISHSHFCGNVGSFPQTTPWVDHRSLSWTTNAVGTVAHNLEGSYTDWYGKPAPSQYNWYPDFTAGTFTGQGQAAWSIAGNSKYVVEGGEFPSVNFTGQQGLVRFAVPSVSADKQAPRLSGATFVPKVVAASSHSVRLTWQANWARDDENLNYRVIRDGNTASPVYSTTVTSQFWNRPYLSFVDTGLTPGTTHTYKIYATSSTSGLTAYGNSVSITLPASTASEYYQQVVSDGALNYWRLDEASGTTATDTIGVNALTEGSAVGHGAPGAVPGDTASTFTGTDSSTAGTSSLVSAQNPSLPVNAQMPPPMTFTEEGWFKTTSTSGGELVGFGNLRTGPSTQYDRNIYLDNAGHVYFGVNNGSVQTVSSSQAYNNGQWHYVVATLSSAGMTLYLDGAKAAANASVTSAYLIRTGYWRVGGDTLTGFTGTHSSSDFTGSIDDVAIYPTALSAAQVASHYQSATSTNQLPTGSFTSNCTNLSCSFDGTASSDPDGTVASYSWTFGDGGTATTSTATHTYAAAGTFSVGLTVTDNGGGTDTATHTVIVAPAANKTPVAAFTSSCTSLSCSFDGTASSDPDGTVTSYSWTFGDGATATTSTASHTYAAAGTFPVALTVTDNSGATNTATHNVGVTSGAGSVAAQDSFGRTVTGGWGSAAVGGAWTTAGVAAANFAVGSGAGSMTLPAASTLASAYLDGVSASDSTSTVDFALSKVPSGSGYSMVYLGARHSGTSQYRARVKVLAGGGLQLSLTKVVTGTETVLLTKTITGVSLVAGQYLRVELQVSGSSSVSLAASVWAAGATPPASPQVTYTDGTSPLGAGGPGVAVYLSSAVTDAPYTASFQNLSATTP